jgi:hypothetical protein
VLRTYHPLYYLWTTCVTDSSGQKSHSRVALTLSRHLFYRYVTRAPIRTLVCQWWSFLFFLLSFLSLPRSFNPTTQFFKSAPKLIFLFLFTPCSFSYDFIFEIILWIRFLFRFYLYFFFACPYSFNYYFV